MKDPWRRGDGTKRTTNEQEQRSDGGRRPRQTVGGMRAVNACTRPRQVVARRRRWPSGHNSPREDPPHLGRGAVHGCRQRENVGRDTNHEGGVVVAPKPRLPIRTHRRTAREEDGEPTARAARQQNAARAAGTTYKHEAEPAARAARQEDAEPGARVAREAKNEPAPSAARLEGRHCKPRRTGAGSSAVRQREAAPARAAH
jgi:hypothetical protein